MENGNVGWQRGESPGRGGSSSGDADTGQDLRWIPVALGAAAIVAKLGGRNKGAAALALSAGAVAAAVGTARGKQQGGGAAGKSEVERSITIGKTADELRRIWLDPRTLPQIIAGFATVRALGDGRLHWKVEGPHGRAWEWETETVDRAGEGIGWHSLSGGAMSMGCCASRAPRPAAVPWSPCACASSRPAARSAAGSSHCWETGR
jgi:uncharacterized membrane protein